MSYAKLLARAQRHNVLHSVLIELTYACNLNCYYCYNNRSLQGKLLSRTQYFQFFEDLRELGVLHLVFSGGEPLMHPDFFVLGARAKELGFVIRLKSNGDSLSRQIIERIRTEIDPFCIDISLHGATAAVHDRQTRVAGSFDRLLKNIQALNDLGLRYRLNVTLTSWNEAELEAMFALADSLASSLNVGTTLSPRDDGTLEPLALEPSPFAKEKTKHLLRIQAAKYGTHVAETVNQPTDCESNHEVAGKHCGIGSSTIAVNPFGRVLPCVQWRDSTDSLHDQRIRIIWEQSELLLYTRDLSARLFDVGKNGENSWVKRCCPALERGIGESSGEAIACSDSLATLINSVV